ncbi:MAG: zf-HC2 domain-containing protein [Acidobacteria bacterium]|nr:zf-HC2 domain-containing protein [Acidobacteriota bacterium]
MTCNPEQILAYIDGELSPDDAARVRAHTASCESCRQILQAEQAIESALCGMSSLAPPPEFADDTVRRAKCDVGHALHSPKERKQAAAVACGLGSLSLLLLWPTGFYSTLLTSLGPLRCMGRFALGWVESSALSLFIVCKTISRGAMNAVHMPVSGLVLLLVLLVAVLVWMLVGYRQQSRASSRSSLP